MQSLTEKLYHKNVIFSYYGFIDNSVLDQVLKITKSKLENNNEPQAVVDRIYDAINNCVENIIEHNFFPSGSILKYKSLLVVSYNESAYAIDTINVINQTQKDSIEEHLAFLNSKSKEELESVRSGIISKNQQQALVQTAGLGLVDLMIKSDNCSYSFKEYESDNFLFNINFKINSTK
jgi:hypothetical protein